MSLATKCNYQTVYLLPSPNLKKLGFNYKRKMPLATTNQRIIKIIRFATFLHNVDVNGFSSNISNFSQSLFSLGPFKLKTYSKQKS